jgi:ABC-type transport system involved in multi-copper enzyme maturation permease subunit
MTLDSRGFLHRYWRILVGLAVLLAGSVLLLQFQDQLELWQQAAGWIVLVVGVFVLMRQALEYLVGPVLVFDVVRTARRSRYALLRSLYAFLMLGVLFLVYTNRFGRDLVSGLAGIMDEQTLPPSEASRFAASFFHTFIIVQFVVIVMLAPAFTAGAIAEEKEKGTLPDLLTTELSGREIILGKLVSRISHLVLLLLAGVPILSLLQLLGGVDPSLLVAGFGLTLTTAIGVGSVSLLCSVHASRPRDAVFLTYVLIAGYQLVSSFYGGVFLMQLGVGSVSQFVLGTLNAGNLVASYMQLTNLSEQGALPSTLPVLLLEYATFHGVLAFICVSISISRLREKAVRLEKTKEHKLPPGLPPGAIPARVFLEQQKLLKRPSVGDGSPMVWKERFIERGAELHPVGQQIMSMTAVIVLAIAGTVFGCGLVAQLYTGDVTRFVNEWLKICVSVVAGVGMIGLALRAAGAISSERERQTLDSLLTSDLTAKDILVGKVFGCIWGMRKVGIVLGVMLALGVLTGGILPPFLLLVLLALFAHAAFAVCLGMYCSLVSRTSLRATVATVSVLLAFTIGHWLVLLVVTTLCHVFGVPQLAANLRDFHLYGLTPPMTLVTFMVPYPHPMALQGDFPVQLPYLREAMIGTLFYGLLALLLWMGVWTSFGKVTGRER